MHTYCWLSGFSPLVQFWDPHRRTFNAFSARFGHCPNPWLSHCYKNQKRLVDQTSLLLIISLTLTTFTTSATVSIIELYEIATQWQYFNQNLKISLILELLGCMLIAITALIALSKLFRNKTVRQQAKFILGFTLKAYPGSLTNRGQILTFGIFGSAFIIRLYLALHEDVLHR